MIKWLWPFWDFTLKNTSNKKVFIATGTWLSPIYHMIEKSWDREKELYFWVQTEKDLFYLKELQKIPNLKIHIYLSREENSLYKYGRIDYTNIVVDKKTEIYICWSPWLIDDLNLKFTEWWHTLVYYEKFL
jgi:NAD(P)H-flavin reductase